MPSYAILGATGQTGRSLLTLLSQSPNTTTNAYVRSKPKLLAQSPHISTNPSVHIFEGRIEDVPLIASCIENTDAVFAVVATNENVPSLRVAQQTANMIVAAMCYNRQKQLGDRDVSTTILPEKKEKEPPHVIFLSSASLNPRLRATQFSPTNYLLHTAFSNVYADLELAESYLRLHKDWMSVTFMKPGGLVLGKRKGHKLSLDEMDPFVSYADLASGMIEVAESKGAYEWMGVGVVASVKGTKVGVPWRELMGNVSRGLTWHFFPALYWFSRYF